MKKYLILIFSVAIIGVLILIGIRFLYPFFQYEKIISGDPGNKKIELFVEGYSESEYQKCLTYYQSVDVLKSGSVNIKFIPNCTYSDINKFLSEINSDQNFPNEGNVGPNGFLLALNVPVGEEVLYACQIFALHKEIIESASPSQVLK